MGGSTIAGQCIGANDIKRAKTTARQAALIGTMSMAFITIFALLFPEHIMKIFTNDQEVLKTGVSLIKIGTMALVAASITAGLGCVFTGSGYNIPYLVSSTTAVFYSNSF